MCTDVTRTSYLICHTRDHHESTLMLVNTKPQFEVFSTPPIPGLNQRGESSTEPSEALVLRTIEVVLS